MQHYINVNAIKILAVNIQITLENEFRKLGFDLV